MHRCYHAGTEGDHCRCCPGAGGDGGIIAVIDMLVVLVGYCCCADDGSVGSWVVVITMVMVVGCSLWWGNHCQLSLSCIVLCVEVTHAPGTIRRQSVHKYAVPSTIFSVDLVIVLFRVDNTCHRSCDLVTRHTLCCI